MTHYRWERKGFFIASGLESLNFTGYFRNVGRESCFGVQGHAALQSCLLFSRSVVSNSFAVSWTIAHQAPLSMGFSRQEYWSGLASPPPEDLPEPGIEPDSPALAEGFFTTEPPGKLYVELDPVGKKEQVQQTKCQTVRAKCLGTFQKSRSGAGSP